MKNSKLILILFAMYSCGNVENTEEQKKTPLEKTGVEKYYNEQLKPFYHGVASGDPGSSSIILWTKITPEWHQTVSVDWEIASDSSMAKIIQKGNSSTDADKNYTVKIDVQNLESNSYYYYRFKALGSESLIGRTKTCAKPGEEVEVKLAFASCSNFSWGYFNSYAMLAKDTLDAIVHLGDYIYEHEPEVYSNRELDRAHIPAKELIALNDYRTRYSQYRLDPDLMEAHRMHPFITVWDDHEFANNTWKAGAGNHQENEGDWKTRFEAAKKAYYEWMPVREQKNNQLYRSFDFGNTLRLLMLDTRVEGRDEQVYDEQKFLADSSRKMISDDQLKWIGEQLKGEQTWNIFGNQVMYTDTKVYFSGAKGELYADGWAAYPYQKKLMQELLIEHPNTFFVTGDFHSSFVIPFDYFSAKNSELGMFVEFVVPSLSAGNYDEDYGLDSAEIYRKYYLKGNPAMVYSDLVHHGYLKITLGKTSTGSKYAKNEFKFTKDVIERNANVFMRKEFVIVLDEINAKKMLRLIR